MCGGRGEREVESREDEDGKRSQADYSPSVQTTANAYELINTPPYTHPRAAGVSGRIRRAGGEGKTPPPPSYLPKKRRGETGQAAVESSQHEFIMHAYFFLS